MLTGFRNGTIEGIKGIIKNLNDATLDDKTGAFFLSSPIFPASGPGHGRSYAGLPSFFPLPRYSLP